MASNDMRKALIDGGYLDDAQFTQLANLHDSDNPNFLENLHDSDNPNFLEDLVKHFYNHSVPEMTHNIQEQLGGKPLDFAKLYTIMTEFTGTSSRVGAKRVTKEVDWFRAFCSAGNDIQCGVSFQKVKEELETLKPMLESYLQVAKQAGAAKPPN